MFLQRSNLLTLNSGMLSMNEVVVVSSLSKEAPGSAICDFGTGVNLSNLQNCVSDPGGE